MRSRIIKPSFFNNEDLAACDPLARILFAGLWCIADADGRLEDRPARIKSMVMPFDETNVDGLLTTLHNRCFILRYQVDGKRYLEIKNWDKHAKPHPNEKSEGFPAPQESGNFPNESGTNPPILILTSSLSSSPLIVSSEPQEAAAEPTVPAAAGMPKRDSQKTNGDASPTGDRDPVVLTFPCTGPISSPREWHLRESKLREYAEAYPAVDVLLESRKALQWCRDNPTKRKTYRGSAAFLTRWLAKAQDRGGNGKAIPRSADSRGETIAQKIARLAAGGSGG